MRKVNHLRKLRRSESFFKPILFDITPYGVVNILIKYKLFAICHSMSHHLKKVYPNMAQMYVRQYRTNCACVLI